METQIWFPNTENGLESMSRYIEKFNSLIDHIQYYEPEEGFPLGLFIVWLTSNT